ncbi:MAG: hypothetical protein WCP35_07915 [Verrucomicrobiota bacterium]
MLGHSGVGKTTYMASAYYGLNNGPLFFRKKDFFGFGVSSKTNADHNRLLELGKRISKGVYPSATDQRTNYDFWLTFVRPGIIFNKRENLQQFVWSDYRGGALQEKTSTSEAVTLLLQDLSEADAIIVFADADALQVSGAVNVHKEIQRLSSILIRAVTEASKSISVVIAFTKVDLLPKSRSINNDILSHFNGLFDIIKASDKIIGTYLSVSCGEQPHNTHYPLLFVLSCHYCMRYYELQTKVLQLKIDSDEARKKAEKYEDRSSEWLGMKGICNKLVSTLIGEKSLWELAQNAHHMSETLLERAKLEEKDMLPMLAPAEKAFSMCNALPLLGRHAMLSK